MNNNGYPIILGLHGEADKVVVIGKDNCLGKYSLYVCRLKKPQQRGADVPSEDIGSVITQMHFCNLETARVFSKACAEMVRVWEADE